MTDSIIDNDTRIVNRKIVISDDVMEPLVPVGDEDDDEIPRDRLWSYKKFRRVTRISNRSLNMWKAKGFKVRTACTKQGWVLTNDIIEMICMDWGNDTPE